jgi:protein-disulfide isomerase
MSPSSTEHSNRNEWFIPGAIVVAGIILAFAVYTIHYKTIIANKGNPSAVLPISSTDHLMGNPTAPVVIIEYADMDSEYSKQFQLVMEQVMQTYGPSGNVAWVYRQFPLIGEDALAEEDAEASECVAAEGGANGSIDFFKFIDDLQTTAPGDAEFNPAGYDAIVTSLGLSSDTFDACLKARTYEKQVGVEYENALAIGATGAPFNVLLVKGQTPTVISGGLPYSAMKSVIDQSIAKVLNQ